MSGFVLDASMALYLASTAQSLPDGVTFAAPALMSSETTSVLHEAVWRRELSAEVAADHRRRLTLLPVTIHRSAELHDRAWALADELGWAKTYDAEYVALAQILSLPLLTLDRRLADRVRGLVSVASPNDLS